MANETPAPTFYCSFCGKNQHEVRTLIAGPSVFICDECVDLCVSVTGQSSKVTALQREISDIKIREVCLQEKVRELATEVAAWQETRTTKEEELRVLKQEEES